jgi:hypothetical protein
MIMEIRNHAQFKRAIKEKKCFIIRQHYIKPEFTGQLRKPNIVQTNGFYSITPDDLNSKVSTANYGKGYWLEFGKASDWVFENGLCRLKQHRIHSNIPVGEFVIDIEFVD